MKYHLAADGGGTKLIGIVYDDDMRVIRKERTGGTNVLFRPRDDAEREMDEFLDRLLEGIPALEDANLCLVGSQEHMRKALSERISVGRIRFYSESEVGLASSFLKEGAVALSGTGSFGSYFTEGKRYYVGGWGSLLGDEGSGYDVGMRVIRAAIHSSDGRGRKTLLEELVKERFSVVELWDLVTRLGTDKEVRHSISSCAMLCAKAAERGDEVAIGIYKEAGKTLALHVRCAVEKAGVLDGYPVLIMGSVWRGSPAMLESFKSEVKTFAPGAEVLVPAYEPVAGAAICGAMADGIDTEELKRRCKGGFASLEYRL